MDMNKDTTHCFETFCRDEGHGEVKVLLLLSEQESDNLIRRFDICFVIFNSEEIVETICSETQFEIKTKSTCLRKDNQERDSDKLRPYGFITLYWGGHS